MSRLKLPGVTVCAADSSMPALAARALELCIDRCDFADAILFSDLPVAGRFRHVAIDRLTSIDDYSRFCLREMGRHIATDFALIVQWDGYVVDPAAWTNAFLKVDYIGAVQYPKEGGIVVGNGGFSLRSRKLLAALPGLPVLPGVAEDWIIGKLYRKALEEDRGIRFASPELADRFSYEVRYPEHPTFGFHGPPNFWRHESDAEIIRLYESLPPARLPSMHFFWLLLACLGRDRPALATALYAMLRREFDATTVARAMSKWLPADVVRRAVLILERTRRRTRDQR